MLCNDPYRESGPRKSATGVVKVLMRYWGQQWIALAILIAGLALLGPASASARTSRPAVQRLGLAPRDQSLPLVFPLRADVAGLERFAAQVSAVGSPLYGHYEPVSMLARRFGASLGDRLRVARFLHRAGATHVRIDATGLFADASLSVGRATQIFGASLSRFHAARAGQYVAPTGGAQVPPALRGAVTGVVGLNTKSIVAQPAVKMAGGAGFPRTQSRFRADQTPSGYQHRTGTPAGCAAGQADRGFTPNQYLDAYGYSPLHALGINGQGERVSLIEIDGFRYSDLRTFANCFGLPIPAINGFGVNIKHPLAPIGETELDLQVMDAAAPQLKAIDVYESRARPADVLQSLTAPLQNRGRVPDVISVSLGVCEPALALAVGRSGLRAVEGALALETASGISVLASSGDAGSSSCIVGGGPLPIKALSFPASSPYVTGVGGTNFVLGSANQIQGETVWNDAPYDLAAGGGGTSVLFNRPGYQNGFVSQRRRNVPDVAMLADLLPGYNIFCSVKACQGYGNGWVAVGGTSASSPLFAGGLALIDQLLRQSGKQSLGLANSLLYKIQRRFPSAGAFSDIQSGNNDLGAYLPGGNHRPLGCCSAGPGYDRASGLGSPNLAKLATLALDLQPPIAEVGISVPAQRPILRRHLVVRATCSRRCLVAVSATVTIAGGRSMHVGAARQLLRKRGRHIFKCRFSTGQLRRLRSALHGHRRIQAQIVGQVVDPGGSVEATSRMHTLRIRH
jgi:subtilase family serine protease